MRPRTLISLFTFALAAGSGACSSGSQPAANETTDTTRQAQAIVATSPIMFWPAGAVAWDGLNATWPISVWSTAAIGGLAFNVAGMNNLGLSVVGYPNLVATTITTPWLNAFVPAVGTAGALGLGAPFFGANAGLVGSAFGFDGTFNPAFNGGFGFGAFGPAGALQGTWLNGTLGAGWGTGWWTPALTSSALMFTNLTALNSFTPYTINVTFQAASASQAAAISTASFANTAALSIFATPITADALTASIPFTSMAFPIMAPFAGVTAAAAGVF